MSQKSLIFSAALFISLVSGSLSIYATPAEVKIRLSSGPAIGDCVNGLDSLVMPWSATFTISARATTLQDGASIGFVIYSPDGSIVAATIENVDLLGKWASTDYWNLTGGLVNFQGFDGTLPETFGTGGAANSVAGFNETGFVDITNIEINFNGEEGVLCIDSAFHPPAGPWLMTPGGPPVWYGGGGDMSVGGSRPNAFCVTVQNFVTGEGECIFSCSLVPSAAVVRALDTLSFLAGPDVDPGVPTPQITATTDGAGELSVDSLGNVSFIPDTADVNSNITITSGYQIIGQFTICSVVDTGYCACLTDVTVLPPRNCCDISGDANHSGERNIADATFLISYIFTGGSEPFCLNEADMNNSGSINIADATYMIAFIFSGGVEPVCGSTVL